MRIISTEKLAVGMKLGKVVYSTNGSVLLQKDVVITSNFIRSLINKNIPAVYIDDELSKDIEVKNAVDADVKTKAVQNIKSLFEKLRPSKNAINTDTYISPEDHNTIRNTVNHLLSNLNKNSDCLFNITELMSTDLATYIHSVNVAIMSMLTAKSMEFSESRIIQIGIGALLHDIGFIKVPSYILHLSPDKFTELENEEYQNHTLYGYDMVKNNDEISAVIKNIILTHHERLDGSGYPYGFFDNKINQYSRIVAICDEFENLVSTSSSSKMPIYRAIEIISSKTTSLLDMNIYKYFYQNIAVYPRGTGVILSDGTRGLVTEDNPVMPTRPKIRLIYDAEGQLYKKFQLIDLMDKLTLFVEDSCDITY